MISADALRDARIRAGYTSQAALADALGVSERTVTNWETEGGHVSARAEARVRALLWPAPGPLSTYSNYELLSELGRRLDIAQRVSDTETGGEGNNPVYDVRTSENASTDDIESGTNSPEPPRSGWGPLT